MIVKIIFYILEMRWAICRNGISLIYWTNYKKFIVESTSKLIEWRQETTQSMEEE